MSKKANEKDLVRLLCWSCGKRVKVPTKFAGKTGTCPKCKSKIQIPTIKTIKSTLKKLEKENSKKKVQDIDFPSLPSLKVLSLDDGSTSLQNNQLSLSIDPPSGTDATGELLVSSTEIPADDDFDISNELGNVDSKAFDQPASNAVKPSRSVRPDNQFITSADEQFYSEIAGAGLEKTETWEESQEVKAAVTTNSGIFHTPSTEEDLSDDSLGGEDIDSFDASSFEAEPMGDDLRDPLSDFEDEGIDFDDLDNDMQPSQMDNVDAAIAQSFDANEAEDFPMAQPLEIDMGDNNENVEMAQPISMDAEIAQPFEIDENVEDAAMAQPFEIDENAEEVNEISQDDIEEIDEEIDDISSVHEINDMPQDGEELEDDVIIEGSEILPADIGEDAADALFLNDQNENSEVALSDENFKTNYKKIIEEENISGSEDINLGWQNFQNQRWEEALYYFTKSIVQKQDAAGYYARSLIYVCEGSWEKALADMIHAKKQGYHKADVENRYYQIIFNHAKHCWEIGAFDKALQHLSKMETKDSQILKGKVHWKRAQFFIENGAYKKALSDLDDAIFNNYVKAEIFAARGQIYFKQGDYESAIYDFTAAMNRGSKNFEMYRARSEGYFYLGKIDDALNDIEDAIVINEKCASLYTLKGLILTKKENFNEANDSFNHAISIEPSNSNHYFNRGLAHIIQKRYDRAVDDFTKVIQFNKEDKTAYFKRAICYQEKTNPNLIQAREDFKTADNKEKDSVYRTDLFEE